MCTNLLLSVPNIPGAGAVYASARTLELAGTLETSLYAVPPGQSFPQNKPPEIPFSGTSQYGFVGAAASPPGFAKMPCFMDGLNTEGLGLGGLWLPGTKYAKAGPLPNLWFSDVGAWILGSFSSVAEVQAALPKVSIIGPAAPAPGTKDVQGYLPLHFIVTDKTGTSLVIEFVDGKTTWYTSADGVLTNAPIYPWQLQNLANYQNLDVVGPTTSLSSTGGPPVGGGLLGMPGDTMSPSRFVRAATLIQGFKKLPPTGATWLPAPGGVEGGAGPVQTVVNVAMQLVQAVMETPYGTMLENPAAPTVGDWTMWAVVRDHTNATLYFNTAFNGIMRSIDVATAVSAAAGSTFPNYPAIPLLPAPPAFAWCEDATAQFS